MQLNQQANGNGARTDAVTGWAGIPRSRPENEAGARSWTWSAPRERRNVQAAATAGAADAGRCGGRWRRTRTRISAGAGRSDDTHSDNRVLDRAAVRDHQWQSHHGWGG